MTKKITSKLFLMRDDTVFALLIAMVTFLPSFSTVAHAQVARVLTLADSLVGGVGGVAIDRLGNVYSADFMDTVWRIKPDGRVTQFATGFYGASGNTFDSQGILYQSNFYGNYISRVERDGTHSKWMEEGLNGPVGLSFDNEGYLWVVNCPANAVLRIGKDKKVKIKVEGDLFNCPNGITSGPDGAMYVVNYSDGRMIRIELDGTASLFTTVPGGGNGHVAVARGDFYVTSFQSHRIFRVTQDASVTLVAGTGAIGEQDGDPSTTTFTFPNGIAVNPNLQDRLFVNDYINRPIPGIDVPPVPLANLRMLKLESFTDILASALRKGGINAMEEAYREHKGTPVGGGFTELTVNGFGYALMGQGLTDAAVRVFELNAESYPASFNVFDSLAEGYMNQGSEEKAIQFYEKSLEINPQNQNAIDMIAKIRAN